MIRIKRVQKGFAKVIYLLIALKKRMLMTWQKYKINWIFGILFLIVGLALSSMWTEMQKELEEKTSMGTLFVYSIPIGAEVYIAPEGTLEAENIIGLQPKIGSPESFVGRTPSAKKLEPFKKMLAPGFYDVEVRVTAEQIHNALGNSGDIEFEFDGNFVIVKRYDPPGSGNVASYSKIYKVWIVSGRNTSLIALFQPKNVSYSVLLNTSLFPPEEKFKFNEEEIKNYLLKNGAKPSDVPYMLKLLRRGGKIVWRYEGYRYVKDLINMHTFTYTEEVISSGDMKGTDM